MAVIDGKKRCPKCGVTFVVEDGFHRSYGSADGYQGWCKKCVRAAQDVLRTARIAKRRAEIAAKSGDGGAE